MHPGTTTFFSTLLVHDDPVVFHYTPQKILCGVH
jgi:hypothetical protein